MTSKSKIVGRYAPSPTGQLHLGNLRTALLAWLSARSQGGHFLLRMEDLDAPRVVNGSADQILRDLEWLGLDWDGPVMYQSARTEAYQQAINDLERQKLIYPCYCSRKEIQQSSSAPHGNTPVYMGTCRALSKGQQLIREQHKVPSYRVMVSESLKSEVGDFVVKRADNLFAYQLAVVVDDLSQGVTEVVRGADLISSTSRQQYLMCKLNDLERPIQYYHAPLMMDQNGVRMSKRDGAESLAQWRGAGGSAHQLIAFLISSLGVKIKGGEISAFDFLQAIPDDFFKVNLIVNINAMHCLNKKVL